MISRLKDFLTSRIGPDETPATNAHARHLAVAALLFAVVRADYARDPREEQAIRTALSKAFGLSAEELTTLVELAHSEAAESTSDHAFVRVINSEFSDVEKSSLIEAMWRVAYADGNLHKYEEHLIRRIADLLYVPHSEFIRTKLRTGGRRSDGN